MPECIIDLLILFVGSWKLDAYISWTCYGRTSTNLLGTHPFGLSQRTLRTLPPSKTNSITMDLFSLIDSIVYYPSTTPEEEGIPVEFETGGNTGVGCVIV